MLDPLTLKTLVLAGLAFQGVTMVLYVLARQHQIATERHDLIRAARQRRLDYLQSMEERREAINAMKQQRQANPLGLASHARGDHAEVPAGRVAPAEPPAARAA